MSTHTSTLRTGTSSRAEHEISVSTRRPRSSVSSRSNVASAKRHAIYQNSGGYCHLSEHKQLFPEFLEAWQVKTCHENRSEEEQEILQQVERALHYQRRAQARKAAAARAAHSSDTNVLHDPRAPTRWNPDSPPSGLYSSGSYVQFPTPERSQRQSSGSRSNAIQAPSPPRTPQKGVRHPASPLLVQSLSKGSTPQRDTYPITPTMETPSRGRSSPRSRRSSRSAASILLQSLSRGSSQGDVAPPTPPKAPPASNKRLAPLSRFNPFIRARSESLSSVVVEDRPVPVLEDLHQGGNGQTPASTRKRRFSTLPRFSFTKDPVATLRV